MEGFLKKRRPPEHIRPELDFGYVVDGQSVELLEIRPHWRDPSQIQKMPFAKATYVKSNRTWKVYWKRASGKWESYTPNPVVKDIGEFTEVVDKDAHYCFFG